MGVRIEVGEPVETASFPDGPTIVATKLAMASRLLRRELAWPGARTALVDVAASRRAGWPSTVADVRSDLLTCCMIERTTATEPELLDGGELFQAQLGLDHDVPLAWGVARIEDGLDHAVEEWRARVLWRRELVVVNSTGAVDPPGSTWRDRPAIDQGDDQFLAGDAVASPGMLSEVAVNSGVDAGRMALDARRRRVFAPGWPSVELSPERRFAILAGVLPAASFARAEVPTTSALSWGVEPVDQTGVGYKLSARAGMLWGTAVTSSATGGRVTSLVWSRLPQQVAGVLNRRLAQLRLIGRRSSAERSTT
jgi:hypothetical protein